MNFDFWIKAFVSDHPGDLRNVVVQQELVAYQIFQLHSFTDWSVNFGELELVRWSLKGGTVKHLY